MRCAAPTIKRRVAETAAYCMRFNVEVATGYSKVSVVIKDVDIGGLRIAAPVFDRGWFGYWLWLLISFGLDS